MLGIWRRRSHRALARKELNESLDHFMKAATHAAGGMGAAVGPRVNAAREYVTPTAGRMKNAASQSWESTVSTIAPFASAAKDGARSASDVARRAKSRNRREPETAGKRWSMLAGLLAAGAAVGAAGSLVLRRRKQRWEEYDPAHALESMQDDTESMADSASTTAGRAADRIASTAADDVAAESSATLDTAKEKSRSTADTAKGMASSAKDTAASAGGDAQRQAGKAADQADDLVSRSTPSRNSRS